MEKFFVFIFLILGQFAFAFASSADENSFNFKQFQAGGSYLLTSNGYSFGPVFNYAPRYRLKNGFSVGLNLGIQFAKFQVNQNMSIIEYLAVGEYSMNDQWRVGLQVGAQTWSKPASVTYLAAGPQAIYHLTEPVLGLDVSIWGRYLFSTYEPVVHEFSSGVAIQL